MRGVHDTEEIRELKARLKILNTQVRQIERKIAKWEEKKRKKKNDTVLGRGFSFLE